MESLPKSSKPGNESVPGKMRTGGMVCLLVAVSASDPFAEFGNLLYRCGFDLAIGLPFATNIERGESVVHGSIFGAERNGERERIKGH